MIITVGSISYTMSAGSGCTCNSAVDPLGVVCNTGLDFGEGGCSAFPSSVSVGSHNWD